MNLVAAKVVEAVEKLNNFFEHNPQMLHHPGMEQGYALINNEFSFFSELLRQKANGHATNQGNQNSVAEKGQLVDELSFMLRCYRSAMLLDVSIAALNVKFYSRSKLRVMHAVQLIEVATCCIAAAATVLPVLGKVGYSHERFQALSSSLDTYTQKQWIKSSTMQLQKSINAKLTVSRKRLKELIYHLGVHAATLPLPLQCIYADNRSTWSLKPNNRRRYGLTIHLRETVTAIPVAHMKLAIAYVGTKQKEYQHNTIPVAGMLVAAVAETASNGRARVKPLKRGTYRLFNINHSPKLLCRFTVTHIKPLRRIALQLAPADR